MSFWKIANQSSKLTIWSIGLISAVINLLALTGSLYMMQIYDRVMSSRSIPTLIALSIIAIWFYALQGILDLLRTRISIRISSIFHEIYSKKIFNLTINLPRTNSFERAYATSPIRDFETIRSFLAGPGPLAIFDLPWVPIFLLFITSLHPALGFLAFSGALALCFFAWINDRKAAKYSSHINQLLGQRNSEIDSISRNHEVIHAMGMNENLNSRWENSNHEYLKHNISLSDLMGGLNGFAKVFRYILQSAVLGLGAYLVIKQEFSPGSMIGASIIMSRALAPIEGAIANWKSYIASKQASKRIDALLISLKDISAKMKLPAPRNELAVENASIIAPQSRNIILDNVSIKLNAGTGLAILGPSASGKSSLARAIVGVWSVARGSIRLDGAELSQWSNIELGNHIGFLPQNVQLFRGTISQNISRFEYSPNPLEIISASKQAGIHEIILGLPNGYDTEIFESGGILSAGQRQRLGLARALYKDPFLVVLDEPNSNLDSEGEFALYKAISAIKQRGGIVIIVAHQANILNYVELVAVIANGQLQAFGPRDDVLRKVLKVKGSQDNSADNGP